MGRPLSALGCRNRWQRLCCPHRRRARGGQDAAAHCPRLRGKGSGDDCAARGRFRRGGDATLSAVHRSAQPLRPDGAAWPPAAGGRPVRSGAGDNPARSCGTARRGRVSGAASAGARAVPPLRSGRRNADGDCRRSSAGADPRRSALGRSLDTRPPLRRRAAPPVQPHRDCRRLPGRRRGGQRRVRPRLRRAEPAAGADRAGGRPAAAKRDRGAGRGDIGRAARRGRCRLPCHAQ